MSFVNSCPKNKDEYLAASNRLRCGTDIQNNNQYMCLPNQEKTSLVELCYDGLMGAREKGNCMEATLGKVIERSCQNFTSGCPNNTFWDNEFYKYPACQNIDTKHQCYVMEPSCFSQSSNEETSSHDTVVYIGSSLGGFILIIAVAVAIVILKRRLSSLNRDKKARRKEQKRQRDIDNSPERVKRSYGGSCAQFITSRGFTCIETENSDFKCCSYQRNKKAYAKERKTSKILYIGVESPPDGDFMRIDGMAKEEELSTRKTSGLSNTMEQNDEDQELNDSLHSPPSS